MLRKFIFKTLKCVAMVGIVSMTACAGKESETPADEPVATEAASESEAPTEADPGAASAFPQLSPVKPGEEIAVMHTSMGDIKLRFFPEQAPKAVENFITHAKNGYYDGVIFHRVINDFMIQGGDPEGTGMGGESIWGAGFENEFDLSVRNFRGALSMAHSAQPNSNGSQFFIVQNNNLNPQYVSMFEELRGKQDEVVTESEEGTVYNRDLMPVEVIDEYIKNGGTPHLDALFNPDGHTVFGHVIEGMDVVDAIAALPVVDAAAENHQPVEDVVINSISFEIAP